ncbi:hypothetical protein LL912_10215 [Niabella sp. CC-SYL272]|uniref:hypothetical protein n=1 Tax=Niabella agricola TaxID=2891571 RepID=UPI001F48EA3A|nr:hypothetical protein [Niabella agricola]MCF3109152.1 hypothetical protein [Niabella agricola]
MKKIQYLLLVLTLSVAGLPACNRKHHAARATITKDHLPIQYQGLLMPGSLRLKNDSVFMALYPSATLYYLDLRLKSSTRYHTVLKQAVRANAPVHAWVFIENKSPVEVAKIEPASGYELKKWNKTWITPQR